MRFMLLLVEDDPAAWLTATQAQRDEVFAAHEAFNAAVRERGEMLSGAALDDVAAARTLRTGTVTEGPYAETVEQLTGFYLIKAPSLDDAVELSRILPSGYTIEVRPVIDIEGYDEE